MMAMSCTSQPLDGQNYGRKNYTQALKLAIIVTPHPHSYSHAPMPYSNKSGYRIQEVTTRVDLVACHHYWMLSTSAGMSELHVAHG